MSFSSRPRRIHFVGIGGVGMSGLAEISIQLGHVVSGSDVSVSENVQRLEGMGAVVSRTHSAHFVEVQRPEVLVYSSAVRADNPELTWARGHGVPVIRRAEMLAELMRLKRGVAVAGSHGKTTTTGMIATVLREAGLDPTIVIGGKLEAISSTAFWGKGNWLIAEADESDGSFLRLSPEVAVVTNIDREHLDHYKSMDAQMDAFSDFLDRVPFYGRAILCSDCPRLRSFRGHIDKASIWYGFDVAHNPDVLITPESDGRVQNFRLRVRGANTQVFRLNVPGRHNVANAAAALLTAFELGLSWDEAGRGLLAFHGVRRRFDLRGTMDSHPVIEDYAHHPSEIAATLQATNSVYGREPLVVFQPHRYSRTRDLWTEFGTCFLGAKRVLTLPIYAASETKEPWAAELDGEFFSANIKGVAAKAYPSADGLLADLKSELSHLAPDTPILVLGAGDVSKLIPKMIEAGL